MKTRPDPEMKHSLLPESEEFAKFVNRLSRIDKDQSFYDCPELLYSSMLANIPFANQDPEMSIVTTPLSWLAGYNPDQQLYRYGLKFLLQHPDLIFRSFCEMDLYSIPVINGDIELVKEMQTHGMLFDETNIANILVFLKRPAFEFNLTKLIAAYQQLLSFSSEIPQHSGWMKPLLQALQLENGHVFVDMIIKEFKIYLLKKLLKDPKAPLEAEIISALNETCEAHDFKLEKNTHDVIKNKLIDFIARWQKELLQTVKIVEDFKDTSLQDAVVEKDRELIQTLLLFDDVRNQEIDSQAAIKIAIAEGEANLVHTLIHQINYKNVAEIVLYAFDEKNYKDINTMAGIVRVLSILKNASDFISLKMITETLIKANEKKLFVLSAILMRNLHYYVKPVLEKFQKSVDNSVMREHMSSWKHLYTLYLQKMLFNNVTVPELQLTVFTQWSIQAALSKEYDITTTETKYPTYLSREELRGWGFSLFSHNKFENAVNLFLFIAKQYKKRSYEESQLASICHFAMCTRVKENRIAFNELSHHVNALFNLIDCHSDNVFVMYAQYEQLYLGISGLLTEDFTQDLPEESFAYCLSMWADTLKLCADESSVYWSKYILFRTVDALLSKINILRDNDKKLKGLSLLGSALAMMKFKQPELDTICQQLDNAMTIFLELIKQEPFDFEMISKYADAVRACSDSYMLFEPSKVHDAKTVLQYGVETLQHRLKTVKLNASDQIEVNKALGYLILSQAYHCEPKEDALPYQNFGEKGLGLIQPALAAGDEQERFDLARHHFRVATLYRDSIEEVEKSIEHMRTAMQIALLAKANPEKRTEDEKHSIFLFRSVLCYRMYFLANRFYRDFGEDKKAKTLLAEIENILDDIKKEYGKLNREELVIEMRVNQQYLVYFPSCPKRLYSLENSLNAIEPHLNQDSSYLQEYALGCLHLGHNFNQRGQYRVAENYYFKSIEYNPVSTSLQSIDVKNSSKETKLAILYLADAYYHLASNMQYGLSSQKDELSRAALVLLQAKKCNDLLKDELLIADQVSIKEKTDAALIRVSKIIKIQDQIKTALDLKEAKQNASVSPPANTSPADKPIKCSPPRHVKSVKVEAKDDYVEVLRLRNQYHTKRDQTLLLMKQLSEEQNNFDELFPIVDIHEKNPEPIRSKLVEIEKLLATLKEKFINPVLPNDKKESPVLAPIPKVADKSKKNKKKKNKKKAAAIAKKHAKLKEELEQEKSQPSSPVKKPNPSPEELKQKTFEKMREQEEEQKALQIQEEEKQKKATDEKKKPPSPGQYLGSVLFGSFDATHLLGLSIFRTLPLKPQPRQTLSHSARRS